MITSDTPSRLVQPYSYKPSTLSSHGCILRFLKRFPRDVRVLDVGTATGYVGAQLRREGFRRLCGIERDVTWAAEAQCSYDTVAVADVETDSLPWASASFDVVICADILEHLRDPLRAVRRLSALVAPGGWLLVSLPNVAHWSVRASLLAGHFSYAESGLLDREHLRFFTRATARTLLRNAGLVIRGEEATPLPIARWFDDAPWSLLTFKAPHFVVRG